MKPNRRKSSIMELKKSRILSAILGKMNQSYNDKFKVTMNQNQVLVVSLNEMESSTLNNIEYQILVKTEAETVPTSYQVSIRSSIASNGQVNFETSCLKDGEENLDIKPDSALGKYVYRLFRQF